MMALAAVGSLLAIAACGAGSSEDSSEGNAQSTDHFAYLVDAPLVTTNTGSNTGSSTNAEVLAGRLYPGVFVPGPSGQLIPNTDLVRTQVLPGTNRQVIYTLSEDARYSDDVPVTCTDFLLNVVAGQNEDLFGSHIPLTDQILQVSCEPDQKRFTVTFDEDGGDRWQYLFGPGMVLPAHSIAQKAGMTTAELNQVLHNDDPAALEEIAEIWRTGFDLESFDPQLQVSSGPFAIDSVGDAGEVHLVPNEYYFGDAPGLKNLVLWPQGSDPEPLLDAGVLHIADVQGTQPAWLDRDDPTNDLVTETRVGDLTDSLILGDAGVFATAQARQAFAACIDQTAVAEASSTASGVEAPAVALNTLAHNDPLSTQLKDLTDPHLGVDLELAQSLTGSTVRIGYVGTDPRKAAMVAEITESCASAGITVVDASAEAGTRADLTRVTSGLWGETSVYEGQLDAVLQAIDPMTEVGQLTASAVKLEQLRAVELQMWEQSQTIPLAAQPRRFVIDRTVGNVVVYTGLAGIGWNMDRWQVNKDDDA
ncbi:ABC transporter substrate-binding protein [Corynebacterium alimapuense]|uniref:Peptide ABC transporter n=1 Tax=Corynebacterium alimapuense TaxID=1576874 RepID=A0A3M8K942_9CORY|nr:ABC transporter substrate-binding protein [Corynebacterium alimapuense]RNE49741.1 peptide ABC transporter [Corynebacterium alimapuense]